MRKLFITATLGAAVLGLAACTSQEGNASDENMATAAGEAGTYESDGGETNGGSAGASFPEDARIVEENGVTYRIDADGTRVVLGPNDSRILVEGASRFRVNPDGTRVRIGPDGAVIDVSDEDVSANAQVGPNPSLEVNTSR